jgi:hypothetical protein
MSGLLDVNEVVLGVSDLLQRALGERISALTARFRIAASSSVGSVSMLQVSASSTVRTTQPVALIAAFRRLEQLGPRQRPQTAASSGPIIKDPM